MLSEVSGAARGPVLRDASGAPWGLDSGRVMDACERAVMHLAFAAFLHLRPLFFTVLVRRLFPRPSRNCPRILGDLCCVPLLFRGRAQRYAQVTPDCGPNAK